MKYTTYEMGVSDSQIMQEARRNKWHILKMEYKGVRGADPYKLLWYVQE